MRFRIFVNKKKLFGDATITQKTEKRKNANISATVTYTG